MIQFNLLPDVKVQFIKTQQSKRILMFASVALSALAVVVLVFMVSFSAVQKRHLANLDRDIERIGSELTDNPELTRILSVQNQLNTLPDLYNGRPAVDRLPEILERTTPAGVGIGRLSIDFSLSTIELSGQASTLEMVNSYVDTLKFTTFRAGKDGEVLQAFRDVVLSRFGKDSTTASFSLTFGFEPQLFDNTLEVTLSVPSITTTRSESSPTDLFDGSNAGAAEEEMINGGQ